MPTPERRKTWPEDPYEWQEDGHRLVLEMVTPPPGMLAGRPTAGHADLRIKCPVPGGCMAYTFDHLDGVGHGAYCPLQEELANAGGEAITGFTGELPLPAALRWRLASYYPDDEPVEIQPTPAGESEQ